MKKRREMVVLKKPTLLITIKSSIATEVSENEILQCLPKNIEESIPINFDEQKIEWGKCLEGMPVFTVREIEDHKKESGKNGATIEKTSERRLQFKNECYLNADTI